MCCCCSCSGNDGLLKIWTIKTGECAATLDHHTDRVSGSGCVCVVCHMCVDAGVGIDGYQ